MVIDGEKIKDNILKRLKKMKKPDKFLGAVLVGNDKSSASFLKQKEKIARELKIDFRIYKLSEDAKTDALRREISRLANSKTCGGFTVQLPLPEHINTYYVLNAIPKDKDVDLLSERALGSFYTGRSVIAPPSSSVAREILFDYLGLGGRLRELKAVIVGYGFLVGKPVSFWIQDKVRELSIADDKTKDLESLLKSADIIISGTGKGKLFSAKFLKKKAIVIDFGYSRAGGVVYGDFDNKNAFEKEILYTPTPGGTGPVLVAKLMENFYILNSKNKSGHIKPD